MPYTREELDWVEAEWAYHLHGRQAFLSRDDFARLMAWEGEGVPAEVIVHAMELYFARRAKRPHPRTFVALDHLERDVRKGMKLRKALDRAGMEDATASGWDKVKEPLRSTPKARVAWETWRQLRASAPPPDSPGFLDHFDEERKAFKAFVALAESALGPCQEELESTLRNRLRESKIPETGPVWRRAWDHHWGRLVCEAWGVETN